MSELVYYIASTLDGFIAHRDGSFDGFAWDDEVVADFMADQDQFGTVIMGRKTYDVGLKEGKTNPYPKLRQIVFSKTIQHSPDEAVEIVKSDPCAYVRALKTESTKPIWLCGGADLGTQLLAAGLIDSIVVKLNPVIFGAGVPLFGELNRFVSLTLKNTKTYQCGIVFLTYRVVP